MHPDLMRDEPLHVGRPNVGDRDRILELVGSALDRLWLSNDGPLLHEFEARVAEVARTRHAIATCNATSGIQLSVRAAGIRPGQEVIVPAWTWVATVHALDWIGVVPVFCDVDEETGTIDVEHAERLIGQNTAGILGVHVFGHPCRIDELSALAARHGLPLLFDAAHAIGSTYRNQPLGGFGTAEVFSFHATKYVNSFEGGAVVTNDDDFAERVRQMRNLGLDTERTVVSIGTNARMSEAAAAMGLVSLDIMDSLIEHNRVNHERYAAELADIPGVTLRAQAPGERANHQYIVIEVDESVSGVHRDTVHAVLYQHNVLSRRYFHPGCHQLEPYRANPARHAPLPLPRTEKLAERALALPTGTAIGAAETVTICELVRRTVTGLEGIAA
jgi:dTDP-4-amino-4,6-dideoxygalactose transaminase